MKLKSAIGEEKNKLQQELASHHREAEDARYLLKEAICGSKGNQSLLLSFSFDMEKTQPLPKLTTSVVFYKRQLWVYNLGINTAHDNQGFMAMWTEDAAKRWSKEICSCILAFLKILDLRMKRSIRTFDC